MFICFPNIVGCNSINRCTVFTFKYNKKNVKIYLIPQSRSCILAIIGQSWRSTPWPSLKDAKYASSMEIRSCHVSSCIACPSCHIWAFDFIGPISPPCLGHLSILPTTECYTKLVEAVPLKQVNGATLANFIQDNITCRFGIPKCLLSDNVTPFVTSRIRHCATV